MIFVGERKIIFEIIEYDYSKAFSLNDGTLRLLQGEDYHIVISLKIKRFKFRFLFPGFVEEGRSSNKEGLKA